MGEGTVSARPSEVIRTRARTWFICESAVTAFHEDGVGIDHSRMNKMTA